MRMSFRSPPRSRLSRSAPRARTQRIARIPPLAAIAVLTAVAIGSGAHAALAATSPSCGQSARTNGVKTGTRAGALKMLVPGGADALLVCRYRGMSAVTAGPSSGPMASGLTRSAGEISKITEGLDTIQAGRHIACPMYEMVGSETATFFYRTGPSVVLSVELGGCSNISNGHVTRMGLDTPALAKLQALLRTTTSTVSMG